MRVYLLCIVVLMLSIGSVFAQAGPNDVKNAVVPVSKDILKKMAGNDIFQNCYTTVSVASKIYNENWNILNEWATYDIRGWDLFVTMIGFSDDHADETSTITILVDGDQIVTKSIKGGTAPVMITVPLTGKQTMTIRNNNWTLRFIEPGFIKGNPNRFACPICKEKLISQELLDAHLIVKHGKTPAATTGNEPVAQPAVAATFVVDPNDLDKLADALRKQVDGKPAVKEKVNAAQIGVMTFSLIDITSPSVASNVAEDLTTSLMKSDFQTVERGQLDKVLKELKIQDTAMIDPATAQKIGQGTGCNILLVGSISDRGQFIVINARLLETATGKTIAAERVECRKIELKR